jgi:hypothetical protein
MLNSVLQRGTPSHPESARDGRYGGSSAPGHTFDGFSDRPPQDAL